MCEICVKTVQLSATALQLFFALICEFVAAAASIVYTATASVYSGHKIPTAEISSCFDQHQEEQSVLKVHSCFILSDYSCVPATDCQTVS